MNCIQFRNLITPAVDDRLDEQTGNEFRLHSAQCTSCREQFELEAAIKSMVRRKIPRVNTPEGLRSKILSRIEHLDSCPPEPGAFVRFRRSSLFKPVVFALASAAAMVLFIVFNSGGKTEDVTDENNLLTRSFITYHAIQSGVIQPGLESDDRENIRRYLSVHAGSQVNVPRLAGFVLVGALANTYQGIPTSQLMYRRGSELLAMTQIPLDEVLHGRTATLPLEARNQLMHSGWYCLRHYDGDMVILWTRGTTLCTAVARIEQAELQNVLSSSDEGEPPTSAW